MLDRTADVASLRDWLNEADRDRHLHGRVTSVTLADLVRGTSLGGRLPELAGRSVLVATGDQLTAALALIELDGVARRIILCPPDLAAEHLPTVIADAEIDAIVTSGQIDASGELGVRLHAVCHPAIAPMGERPVARHATEWVMFTSGTTGMPKMVVHTFAGLTGAIKRNAAHDVPVVWGTFYDIRRYGGLQIFFRAVIDGGSLVLSDAKESVADHLVRLGRHGATHVSGTPSHWRRAIMSPSARAMAPRYVRLSGEIADQAVLDNLAAVYAPARVGHAYASTEAGVGFEVNDGQAGFPASMIGRLPSGVDMKVEQGTLRIRSNRTALRYVGGAKGAKPALADADGFVDTGDIVELRGGRYHFMGRSNGVINVGGLKVHPEEVEAVINRHPQVRMSLVQARRSPITGALVVADVVLREDGAAGPGEVEQEILRLCREGLTRHKVPSSIRFVPALAVATSGKLARRHA
jgi:acyl-coenzyme A synthetase/AMP-(fatty) acid ligase